MKKWNKLRLLKNIAFDIVIVKNYISCICRFTILLNYFDYICWYWNVIFITSMKTKHFSCMTLNNQILPTCSKMCQRLWFSWKLFFRIMISNVFITFFDTDNVILRSYRRFFWLQKREILFLHVLNVWHFRNIFSAKISHISLPFLKNLYILIFIDLFFSF